MNIFWLVSYFVLWAMMLLLAVLWLGTARALSLLAWRMDQMQAITPSRIGRAGLKKGAKAPDFTLPSVEGGEVSLRDFTGRKVLLVFTRDSCSPCRTIMPELNQLQAKGEVQVLVVNNGELEATRKWASALQPAFPVLVQERFTLSRRYETYTTPFAFVIDGNGVITSKGIVSKKGYLGFVLSGTKSLAEDGDVDAQPVETTAVNV